MDGLISRKAAIEYLMTNMGWHDDDGYEVEDADEKRKVITDLVNGIPTVDAAPVEWLRDMMLEREAEESRAAWVVMREWRKWKQEQETRNESKV